MRNFIKRIFGLYDIDDLQTIAICGCCGRKIIGEIVPKVWPYAICEHCTGLAI